MSQFQLKSTNRGKAALISVPISVILCIILYKLMPDNMLGGSHQTMLIVFGAIILLILLVPWFILMNITAKNIVVNINHNRVEIDENGIKTTIPKENIAVLRHEKVDAMNEKISFINTEGGTLKSLIVTIRDYKPQKMVADMETQFALIKKQEQTSNTRILGTFINPNATSLGTINTINVLSKKSNLKIVAVIVPLAFIGMAALALPFFINPKAFYDIKNDKVYFGSKELTGVNANEFKSLDYELAKDSAHIYFHENVVPFVDYKTFHALNDNTFYADKNGIYYITTGLYSKHKLAKVQGEFDEQSFESLDFWDMYKDKNELYIIDLGKNPPLQKLNISGIDLPSLKPLFSYWLRDKNKIYFYQFVGRNLKACPEIDLNTFTQVSEIVAKDKNHVYFVTFHLASKDKSATDETDYSVLTNADPESFKKIDEDHYEDKNQTWTINNHRD